MPEIKSITLPPMRVDIHITVDPTELDTPEIGRTIARHVRRALDALEMDSVHPSVTDDGLVIVAAQPRPEIRIIGGEGEG
jgi:hypothetical protein